MEWGRSRGRHGLRRQPLPLLVFSLPRRPPTPSAWAGASLPPECSASRGQQRRRDGRCQAGKCKCPCAALEHAHLAPWDGPESADLLQLRSPQCSAHPLRSAGGRQQGPAHPCSGCTETTGRHLAGSCSLTNGHHRAGLPTVTERGCCRWLPSHSAAAAQLGARSVWALPQRRGSQPEGSWAHPPFPSPCRSGRGRDALA